MAHRHSRRMIRSGYYLEHRKLPRSLRGCHVNSSPVLVVVVLSTTGCLCSQTISPDRSPQLEVHQPTLSRHRRLQQYVCHSYGPISVRTAQRPVVVMFVTLVGWVLDTEQGIHRRWSTVSSPSCPFFYCSHGSAGIFFVGKSRSQKNKAQFVHIRSTATRPSLRTCVQSRPIGGRGVET